MGSRERERRRRRDQGRKERRDRGRKGRARGVKQFLLDLAFAAVIVLVIMGVLFAYSGVWPPLVVVESGSMQHDGSKGERASSIGTIDTGDLVIVKRAANLEEITSYVKGRGGGHSTYGEYGDVIVYRKLGREGTPVIHRALIWVQWNAQSLSWDLPELRGLPSGAWKRSDGLATHTDFRGAEQDRLTLLGVGYSGREVEVRFADLNAGTTGFLTLGDNAVSNPQIDQHSGISRGEPVRFDWILGVARGEIPCFGLIKLFLGSQEDRRHYDESPDGQKYCALGLVVAIIVVPLLYDVAKEQVRRRKVARGELGEDEELEGPFKRLGRWLKRKVLKREDEGTGWRRRRGRAGKRSAGTCREGAWTWQEGS
jgi:signal peptidase